MLLLCLIVGNFELWEPTNSFPVFFVVWRGRISPLAPKTAYGSGPHDRPKRLTPHENENERGLPTKFATAMADESYPVGSSVLLRDLKSAEYNG